MRLLCGAVSLHLLLVTAAALTGWKFSARLVAYAHAMLVQRDLAPHGCAFVVTWQWVLLAAAVLLLFLAPLLACFSAARSSRAAAALASVLALPSVLLALVAGAR
jgi:hypothetical protein